MGQVDEREARAERFPGAPRRRPVVGHDDRQWLPHPEAEPEHEREQQQQREIARPDPALAGIILDIVRKLKRLGGRDRAREALLDAWAAHWGDTGVRAADEAQEGAERRQLARGRRIAEPLGAAIGEIGPKIVRSQRLEDVRIDRAAAMRRKKGAEALGRCDIGTARMLRPALFMRQMGIPFADQSLSQSDSRPLIPFVPSEVETSRRHPPNRGA